VEVEGAEVMEKYFLEIINGGPNTNVKSHNTVWLP
jgi:hypothetical protein